MGNNDEKYTFHCYRGSLVKLFMNKYLLTIVMLLMSGLVQAQVPIAKPGKSSKKEVVKPKSKNMRETSSKNADKVANSPDRNVKARSENSAKTLLSKAGQGEPKAMYDLACAYHEGNVSGVAKDDLMSFFWMMRYYTVCNEKDGAVPLMYIKENLQAKPKSNLTPTHGWVRKAPTNMELRDCFLNPLSVIPMPELMNLSLSKLKSNIQDTYHLKFYDGDYGIKNSIHIRTLDGNQMPQLYGKAVYEMSLTRRSSKHFHYQFDFKFNNRNEAEKFIYRCAYDATRYSLSYVKSGTQGPRKLAENISLNADCKLTIYDKQWRLDQTLYLFNQKDNYSVILDMVLIR